MSKYLLGCWLVIALAVFIYSYGFVDFNLTLSSHPLVNSFVHWSQQLAMFDRSNSLRVYLGLLLASFALYIMVIRQSHYPRFPWKSVLLLGLIFCLAYPFLSSDVFKYLFSAKTVLVYHANPHLVAPQVFEGDLWLRFMRWIHTPSPYGPVQTALAIPYYLISFGKFTPMLYFYKLDQLFWYGLTIWVLGKLGASVRSRLFFALNPLILYEWLVNAHNDAPMIALALLALYLARQGRGIWAGVSLLISIGIKYVTVFFLPAILLSKKLTLSAIVHWSFVILFLTPLLYHYSWQYQPWYVTWLIPFAALTPLTWVRGVTVAYSLGALLRYIPFIQIGLWQGSARYFAALTFVPMLLALIYYLLLRFFRRREL